MNILIGAPKEGLVETSINQPVQVCIIKVLGNLRVISSDQ